MEEERQRCVTAVTVMFFLFRKHHLTCPCWRPVVLAVHTAAQHHGSVSSAAGASDHKYSALLPLQEKTWLVLLSGNTLICSILPVQCWIVCLTTRLKYKCTKWNISWGTEKIKNKLLRKVLGLKRNPQRLRLNAYWDKVRELIRHRWSK